jgi:hypothetical protein
VVTTVVSAVANASALRRMRVSGNCVRQNHASAAFEQPTPSDHTASATPAG